MTIKPALLLKLYLGSAMLLAPLALTGCGGEPPPTVMQNPNPTAGTSSGPGTLDPSKDPRRGKTKRAAASGAEPQ